MSEGTEWNLLSHAAWMEFNKMSAANQSALSCWERAAAKRHGVRSNLTKKARPSVEQKGMLAFIEPVHAVFGESDWLLPSPQIFFRQPETPACAP